MVLLGLAGPPLHMLLTHDMALVSSSCMPWAPNHLNHCLAEAGPGLLEPCIVAVGCGWAGPKQEHQSAY